MPNRLNSASFSSFFKAEDFREAPRVLTIKSVKDEMVGPEGKKVERVVLRVEEDSRGITLNKTRYETIGEILGNMDDDTWAGKKIKFIYDPTVKFGGRKVGGIACQPAE